MPWIEPEAVTNLVGTTYDEGLVDVTISHAQALAEIEIGEQETPSARVKAAFTNVVIRMLRSFEEARNNPMGVQQHTLGPESYSVQVVAGLGLTNADKRLLRKAAGIGGLGVLRMTRGSLETPGPVLAPSISDFEVDES